MFATIKGMFIRIFSLIRTISGVKSLIQITKSEAQLLREKFPNVRIAKTKHKRYVEEDIRAMRALTNNTEARKIVAARNKNKRGV